MPKKGKTNKPEDKVKKEIAKELGLFEKVQEGGFGALTCSEAGKIGGFMASRKKKDEKK